MSNTKTIKKNKSKAVAVENNNVIDQPIEAVATPITTDIAAKPEPVEIVKKTKRTSKKVKEVVEVKELSNDSVPNKVVKEKSTIKTELDEGLGDDIDKRYFKCIMINANGEAISTGRYSGKKPKQAASKACTRLYEDQKELNNTPDKIIFGMHECTRASKKKKKYFYVGRRVKLAEPEEVHINKIDPKTGKNMIIRYFYNNDVTKLTIDDKCTEYQILYNYDLKDLTQIEKKVRNKQVKEDLEVAEKFEVVEPVKEVAQLPVETEQKVKKSKGTRKVKIAKAAEQVQEQVQVQLQADTSVSILPETSENIRVIKKKNGKG